MDLSYYAEVFKALSDETRLRILSLFVTSREELCVCELTDALEVSQYNVSRHLKVLVNVGLLQRKKIGRWVYFKLKEPADAVMPYVFQAIAHLPVPTVQSDLRELQARLKLRTNGRCTIGIQKKHLLGKG